MEIGDLITVNGQEFKCNGSLDCYVIMFSNEKGDVMLYTSGSIHNACEMEEAEVVKCKELGIGVL